MPYKNRENICVVCGSKFQYKGYKKTCSSNCFIKLVGNGKHVNCGTCGKKVYKKGKILAKGFKAHYCSRSCYHFGSRNRIYYKCGYCGKEFITFPSRKNKIGSGEYCSRACFRKSRKENAIESIVGKYLEECGHNIERQYKFHNFIIDFFIPGKKLFIEADGLYWHTLPKRVYTDNIKDQLAIKEGYQLIRVREDEIKNGDFKNKLSYL